jgi:hypothetical protein
MTIRNLSLSLGYDLRRTVSPETVWITTVCLLDLASTLYWVSHGMAHEANPLLARFLEQGSAPFIAAKTASFLPALMFAEWYLPRNPPLVRSSLRCVMTAYVLIYLVCMAAQALHLVGM